MKTSLRISGGRRLKLNAKGEGDGFGEETCEVIVPVRTSKRESRESREERRRWKTKGAC